MLSWTLKFLMAAALAALVASSEVAAGAQNKSGPAGPPASSDLTAYFAGLVPPVAALRSWSLVPVTFSLAVRKSFLVITVRYSVRLSFPSPSLSAFLKFLARYGFAAASVRLR